MAAFRRPAGVPYIFFILVAFLPGALRAQASIDPSLPPAPLPRTAHFSLFPAYEAVENSPEPVSPLTSQQKFDMAYRKIFAPALPIDALAVSGWDQATNSGPAFGQEWGAFGKRLAYNGANCVTKPLLAVGIVPVLTHQDPRYFRIGKGESTARRWRWVMLSQVVAFSDRGSLEPNYGKLFGYGLSTALSNAYMPKNSVSFRNTMEGYSIKFGVSIGVDAVHEFDLVRFFHIPGGGNRP
jgi:hypothetical protein